jgi:hypothetical protein
VGLSPTDRAITVARGRSAVRVMATGTEEVVLYWIDATGDKER